MTNSVWLKGATLWFVILFLAMLNGFLREAMLIPAIGSFVGLTASGIILSVCIFFVTLAGAPWFGPLVTRQWLLLGLFWLVLTVTFEFGFGRLVQHKSWGELFNAYTFREGDIWPIILLVTFISPWLAARLRGLV